MSLDDPFDPNETKKMLGALRPLWFGSFNNLFDKPIYTLFFLSINLNFNGNAFTIQTAIFGIRIGRCTKHPSNAF